MITARVAPLVNRGDCLFLENGIVELVVSLTDLRLLRYGFAGKENMLHLPENGTGGGHFPSILFPDGKALSGLESCAYEKTGCGVRFSSAVSGTGLKYGLEIKLVHGSSEVKIIHSLQNPGPASTLSLCAETDMEEGGLAVLPQSDSDTGDRPNRVIAVWPNTNMADPRILWGDDYILVQQASMKPLKFGVSADHGWSAYFNTGRLFIMRYPVFKCAPYPDCGCAVVVDTREEFTRLSTRSPVVSLGPGETRSHSESWTLYADVPCPPVEEWPVYETLRGIV